MRRRRAGLIARCLMESYSLKELQSLIKRGVESSVPDHVWVRAEINELKINFSGHCYMSLVEKNEGGAGIGAKAQAIIWSSSYKLLAPYFLSATGMCLKEGISVMLKVQVQYNVLYGLSLIVSDIDPGYTVGDVEINRRNTLERLRREGVMDMNASLQMPAMPKRLAVIASSSSAGLRDFMEHLCGNDYGFSFVTRLYDSIMQGDGAPESIMKALDEILSSGMAYDAVLILRGGGGVADMLCFDDYELSFAISQYPLPVFTAIGHDKDFHACDAVAYKSLKTPTALADYFIDLYAGLDSMAVSLGNRIFRIAKNRFSEESIRLERMGAAVNKAAVNSAKACMRNKASAVDKIGMSLVSAVRTVFSGKMSELELKKKELSSAVGKCVSVQDSSLEILWFRLNKSNPLAILEKGFAMLRDAGGKNVGSVADVSEGDRIGVLLKDGTLDCEIKKII